MDGSTGTLSSSQMSDAVREQLAKQRVALRICAPSHHD
jgi:hypothetical protein